MAKQKSRRAARPRTRAPATKPAPAGPSWGKLLLSGLVAVLLAVAVFTWTELSQATAPPGTNKYADLVAKGKPIHGIVCESEMLGYHVHAHLTILDAGRPIEVPAFIGFGQQGNCLYWLHTHDNSGLIHIEAPHTFRPVLGDFFDIWAVPLSRSQVDGVKVRSGQSMRVFVNLKPYRGNPRNIKLHAHTIITIEVGPPFSRPQPYNFDGN